MIKSTRHSVETMRSEGMQTERERLDELAADHPVVSVIMIFLDAERFIEEAIASVFAQTWPHWELLLVDDGSSDHSTTIAKRYAAEHPERVRYFEHAGHVNRGMSASRNHGIAHARGAYIAFLDADDVYLPERLARHVAILETHPEVDLVQSKMFLWHSWTGTGDPDRVFVAPNERSRVVRPPVLAACTLEVVSGDIPLTCNVTFRRGVAEQVGGFEDIFTGKSEDFVFMTKVYLAKNVYILNEGLAKYRQHENSYINVAIRDGRVRPGKCYDLDRRFLDWAEGYFRQQGVADPDLWWALRHRLLPYRHPWLWRAYPWTRAARTAMRAILAALLPGGLFARARHGWRRVRPRVLRMSGQRLWARVADGD